MGFKKGQGYWLGKKRPKFSTEWLEKIRLANNGFKKGNTTFKGKKHSVETLEKMREQNTGEKNPAWKGGVSKRKDYHYPYSSRRRAKKKGNGGKHTLLQWDNLREVYNYTCPSCFRKEPEIKLTRDHTLPIAKGGTDNIDNIQPLCLSCNDKKGINHIKYENKIQEGNSSTKP